MTVYTSNDRLSRTFPPSMSRVERDLNLSQIELPHENISARTDLNQTKNCYDYKVKRISKQDSI